MKLLFSPAIALMNRLGYTKKFTLLALVSTAAFAIVVYGLYDALDNEIKIAQRELEGLALIKPILKIIQPVQQHRGFSVALLSGNEAMREGCTVKEREVSQAFDEMARKLPPGLSGAEDWRSIKADWKRLQKEHLDMTVNDDFAAHTRLIERLLIFQVAVADEYALTLDPRMDTYYLIDTAINKLPVALEHMGQLRAHYTAILTRKQIGEGQKINIYKTIGMLDDALSILEVNLEKTGRNNPAMQSSLSAMSGSIADSARLIIGVMESDILTGQFTISPEGFFAITTGAMDKSYQQLYESLLPATEALLKARIARAETTLYASIGIALLLLLIVTYFAIGIYYSITGNVRSLARSARTFAGGDMSERVRLDTRDELGQIGGSFNEMAYSFNAMHNRLRDSRDDLHCLLNSMAEGVYGVDTDGNCTFVNQSFLQMLGYQNENEVLGKNMHELIHHSHAGGSPYPVSECKIYRAYQTNLIANVADEVFWRKDGTATPVEYWSHPIMTAGVVTGSIVTFVDITERKQKEAQLAKASEALRIAAIAFEAQAAIVVTDTTPKILQVNRAFEEITGYMAAEVIGQNPNILSAPELRKSKAFYEEMWATLLSKEKWGGEILDKRKDGKVYPKQLMITAVTTSDGTITHYVGSFFDITERKQAEEEQRKYNEELKAINHQLQDTQNQLLQSEKMSSIGQLAAGVAHEINNPIGYVHSNLGTLEKYMQDAITMIEMYEYVEKLMTDDVARAQLKAARDKLDIGFLKEDLRALMNESKDGITRVKKIVQNLKDFSHVDTSDEWHFADLHKGLESTLNIVSNEIKYKADVVREYGDLPEIECLLSQLNQVFMNLLVNAAHAIEERGTITLRSGRQEDEVWVEIADTGKGIAPEHLKKIFDPFFTTKPVGKGTGLGLSLSYGIVQKHHGRIEVQSEPGKGTTFRVWLPVKRPQEGQG